MQVTPRYDLLRRELIDMVFSAAFSPSPLEPQPPDELFQQLRPTLELCSLWELLKRLCILEPEHSLHERVALWEVIQQAVGAARPEVVEALTWEMEEDEEFQHMNEELDREFGPTAVYADDSPVLHYKSVSLIMSLKREDLPDPEGRDERRISPSGVNVIEFVDAMYRCHRGYSVFAIDWERVKGVAKEFDQMIKAELST